MNIFSLHKHYNLERYIFWLNLTMSHLLKFYEIYFCLKHVYKFTIYVLSEFSPNNLVKTDPSEIENLQYKKTADSSLVLSH